MIASIFFIQSSFATRLLEEKPACQAHSALLDIEIQGEFPGMRSEPDGIDLILALVLQPGLDHILGKHIAPEQKIMILLQGIERLVQRPRHRFHLGRFLGLELVEVLIDRFGRLDLVSDPVQAPPSASPGKQGTGCSSGRGSELQRLAFSLVEYIGNTHTGAAVSGRVDQVDRRFVAGNQSSIGIGRRRDKGAQRMGVLDQAADIIAGGVADQSVALLVVENVLASSSTDSGGSACRNRCLETAAWASR